jgi:hypothetical protein
MIAGQYGRHAGGLPLQCSTAGVVCVRRFLTIIELAIIAF